MPTNLVENYLDDEPVFVTHTNTCYICGRVFQDILLSEVCSQKCLDFETVADVCAYDKCRKLFILDPCEPSNYCSDDCRYEASRERVKERVAA